MSKYASKPTECARATYLITKYFDLTIATVEDHGVSVIFEGVDLNV